LVVVEELRLLLVHGVRELVADDVVGLRVRLRVAEDHLLAGRVPERVVIGGARARPPVNRRDNRRAGVVVRVPAVAAGVEVVDVAGAPVRALDVGVAAGTERKRAAFGALELAR
jgi:hypothetical protein